MVKLEPLSHCSVEQPLALSDPGDRKMSTSKRGFASISVEKRREIASKGGKSVPAEKRSFSQNRNLASEAGRKGGLTSQNNQSTDEES
jgi:general stress protein YciG